MNELTAGLPVRTRPTIESLAAAVADATAVREGSLVANDGWTIAGRKRPATYIRHACSSARHAGPTTSAIHGGSAAVADHSTIPAGRCFALRDVASAGVPFRAANARETSAAADETGHGALTAVEYSIAIVAEATAILATRVRAARDARRIAAAVARRRAVIAAVNRLPALESSGALGG